MMNQPFIMQPQFNISLATLRRLNQILIDGSENLANQDFLAYKNNLELLYIVAHPFLIKEQKTRSTNRIKKIKGYAVEIDDDQVTLDSAMIEDCQQFHRFIELSLKKNGITYSSKQLNKGLEGQYSKYELNNEPE